MPRSLMFNEEFIPDPGPYGDHKKKHYVKYDMMAGVHNNLTYGKKIKQGNKWVRLFPYKTPHMGHIEAIWKRILGVRKLSYEGRKELRYGHDGTYAVGHPNYSGQGQGGRSI
ncbi:hypothetical protein GF369_02240 [Candidatus Peregrinibacteria bacterium]|nr:hypothetical protein [Candidatus Peregrinibacteria bacterium]